MGGFWRGGGASRTCETVHAAIGVDGGVLPSLWQAPHFCSLSLRPRYWFLSSSASQSPHQLILLPRTDANSLLPFPFEPPTPPARAPGAQFVVHRRALAGKAAGKHVGMWFGPSGAASAIRQFAVITVSDGSVDVGAGLHFESVCLVGCCSVFAHNSLLDLL
ncbi:hypothetical protein K438DRAFT_1967478 [Mycena galopus ATCC 62051]|nr:hypothetical protein K438DRAFT_1967478 [Mycena galopus ATCC 62051]